LKALAARLSQQISYVNIDAHSRLWKYGAAEYGWIAPEMRAIRRDFLPAPAHPRFQKRTVRECQLIWPAPPMV